MKNKNDYIRKVNKNSRAALFANLKDYNKDPFVIKKVEASKKIIAKYGFPKELITG